MKKYAFMKDNVIFNITEWEGPGENGENDLDFGEGTSYVALEEGQHADIGYIYKNGEFEAPPRPPLTYGEMVSQMEQKRGALYNSAIDEILEWQYAVIQEKGSTEEKKKSEEWKTYLSGLKSLKQEDVPDIKWPEKPSS